MGLKCGTFPQVHRRFAISCQPADMARQTSSMSLPSVGRREGCPLPPRMVPTDYCSCPFDEAWFPEVNARVRTPSDRTIKAIGVGSTLWNTASFFTYPSTCQRAWAPFRNRILSPAP